jgi:hypothetical protein
MLPASSLPLLLQLLRIQLLQRMQQLRLEVGQLDLGWNPPRPHGPRAVF